MVREPRVPAPRAAQRPFLSGERRPPHSGERGLKSPGLLSNRVKHPRLWALVLVGVSILPILLGRGLTGCFITANGECFQAYDATIGYSLLITGGLLILAALMILTGAVAAKRRRFKTPRGVRIPNSAKRRLDLYGYWAFALLAVTTTATAMALVLPWWQVRGTDGTSSTLYYSRWCNEGDRPPLPDASPIRRPVSGLCPGISCWLFSCSRSSLSPALFA